MVSTCTAEQYEPCNNKRCKCKLSYCLAHYTDYHSPHATKNERRRLINDERQSINLRQDRVVALPSFTQVPAASTQGDVGHYTVAEEERSRISTIQQLALRFMSRLTTRDSGQKKLNESDFR